MNLCLKCELFSVIPEEVPSDRESDIEDQCPEPDVDNTGDTTRDSTQNDMDSTDLGQTDYDDDFEEYDSSEVLKKVNSFILAGRDYGPFP